MRKGQITSEETKIKIGLANKGKPNFFKGKKRGPLSEEIRKKISMAQKGISKKPFSLKHKLNLSLSSIGKPKSIEHRRKMSFYRKGRKLSEVHKMHIQLSSKRGPDNPSWRGGITSENIKIRTSIEYTIWRNGVLARDGYRCQKYGIQEKKLITHHILNFSNHPELRFAIDNGITLSEKAHKEFHKKYGRSNNTNEQLLEFLKN